MHHIGQLMAAAEAAMKSSSKAGNSSAPISPPHEVKPVCRPRYGSLADWFWNLVERVMELRGCCLSEDSSREKAILRQLEARRFTAVEAALAEQHILCGQWSAEKTRRIGLELSDFYPEAITVTRSEWESLRRRLYRAIQAQVQEEIQWAEQQTKDSEADSGGTEAYKQALRELNQHLQQANERVAIAIQSVQALQRDLQRAEQREKLLQAKIITANEVILRLQRSIAEQKMDKDEPEPELPGQLSLFPEYDNVEGGEFWDVFDEDSDTDSLLTSP